MTSPLTSSGPEVSISPRIREPCVSSDGDEPRRSSNPRFCLALTLLSQRGEHDAPVDEPVSGVETAAASPLWTATISWFDRRERDRMTNELRFQHGLIGIALATLLLVGCSQEGADWKQAATANTIEAYQAFLQQHPHGA